MQEIGYELTRNPGMVWIASTGIRWIPIAEAQDAKTARHYQAELDALREKGQVLADAVDRASTDAKYLDLSQVFEGLETALEAWASQELRQTT